MTTPKKEAIIIQAPEGTKARWVRQSQAHGSKLSDWVVAAVDRPPNRVTGEPCQRCRSVVLTADGPSAWQCAQCGLAP